MLKLSQYVRFGRTARRMGHSLREAIGCTLIKAQRQAIECGWRQADAELRQPNVFKRARFKAIPAHMHAAMANARHACMLGSTFLGYR